MLTRALPQVSLMNFLLVLLWALAMPYCRFRPMASCLSTVWTCIIIVCKMLYQLEVVDPHDYFSNCTQVCPAGPVLGGLPGWRGGLGGRGALTHPLVLPFAAPTQQHQPDPGGAAQLHAVPWPRGPCQLVWHPEGLPQLGIRQGGHGDTVGTTLGAFLASNHGPEHLL